MQLFRVEFMDHDWRTENTLLFKNWEGAAEEILLFYEENNVNCTEVDITGSDDRPLLVTIHCYVDTAAEASFHIFLGKTYVFDSNSGTNHHGKYEKANILRSLSKNNKLQQLHG